MKKVLIVNVNSELTEELRKGNHTLEFEPIELNKHLAEGWAIYKTDIVQPSNSLYSFSIVYVLQK
ncbi:hypothetical protein NYQ10_10020 [Flavobacterium johnsoniae]|uniref:hypothetical protein n=1 Tax=Flavobacterium johnsoniae TaxID=986 RepID=UPI0025AF89CA|nr:hypothetical protein [Flavobacterium johnsoniae]WJS96771.1 hypothetical protein NYQ10_10020 [Flavobacterium johnsoniae]